MYQEHLIVDKRAKDACRNSKVRTNEIDQDNTDVGALGREAAPVPSPPATNVRHDAMRRDATKKQADFPIHDRDRMVAADLEEQIGMLPQRKGLALSDFIGLTRGLRKR